MRMILRKKPPKKSKIKGAGLQTGVYHLQSKEETSRNIEQFKGGGMLHDLTAWGSASKLVQQ